MKTKHTSRTRRTPATIGLPGDRSAGVNVANWDQEVLNKRWGTGRFARMNDANVLMPELSCHQARIRQHDHEEAQPAPPQPVA